MTADNLIGIGITALLVAGFGWAVIDLGLRIIKQRKQPFNLFKLSSYPFVPDEVGEQQRPRRHHRGGMRLRPVPVEVEHRRRPR